VYYIYYQFEIIDKNSLHTIKGGIMNKVIDTEKEPSVSYVKILFVSVLITGAAGVLFYFLTSRYVISQAEKNIQNLLLSHRGIHMDLSDFQLTLNTGEVVVPLAVSPFPNVENNERNVAVIFGEFANRKKSNELGARFPVKCEIVEDETPLMLAVPCISSQR
jgi:hypothetical protein